MVPDGLEGREDAGDEHKEDDRRHDEEAEEVCDPGAEGEERDGENRPVIPERDGVPGGIRERGDVGEAEEGRKEGFGDMVVDEPEDRPREERRRDDRDEPGGDESGLPSGDGLPGEVDYRDDGGREERGDPRGDVDDLGARCRPGDDAGGGGDEREERSPCDFFTGRVGGHRIEPGVAGVVRHHRLDLAEVVPGVGADEAGERAVDERGTGDCPEEDRHDHEEEQGSGGEGGCMIFLCGRRHRS